MPASDADSYIENPPGGGGQLNFGVGAASVPNLLSYVGFALSKVQQAIVSGPLGSGGSPSTLVTADLTDPGTVFVGGLPPVLYISTSEIFYARQVRQADPSAINNLEDHVNSGAGDITIAVTAGTVEPVSLKASTKNPTSGASVTFTAAPSPLITNPQFSWTFSLNGTPTTPNGSATTSHSFTGKGTSYVVTVDVTGDGGFNGSSSITIVAGTKPPPKSPKPKPGTGKSTKKTAPSTGPSTGSGNRVGGIASNTPSTSTSLTEGAQSTESGAASQNQLNAQAAIDALPFVSGRLIGGDVRTISAKSLGAPVTATAPAARIPPKWRLPLSAGAALVVILLLVGGATSEVRPTRRRRRLE